MLVEQLKEQRKELEDSIAWFKAVLERYENRNATKNKDYIECYGLYMNYKGKLEIVNQVIDILESIKDNKTSR